jgi:UDP-2,4-diacetamido-2,4,6-trideoxy-beta-L-altropyranose hydrolase
MPLRVAVRVDASSAIGIGHFMRCLTLADALAERNAHVHFVSRHLSAPLRGMLQDRGFELTITTGTDAIAPDDDLAHAEWLGTSQRADAIETRAALSGEAWDWLVIDHYAIDARWETALRAVARKVLVIDDVADRRHDCDVLLDQNYYLDQDTRYDGKLPPGATSLLGPTYALLRREFRRRRVALQRLAGSCERLLICFGGIDAHDYTGQALQAIDRAALPGVVVSVVIGSSHPNRDAIIAGCAARGFACHVQTDRMPELMAEADLAFGAGGSTSWERCCLSLPTICVATAHNQVAIARGLERAGAVVLAGDGEHVTANILHDALVAVARSPERLRAMSEASGRLVDGLGTDRVCERMLGAA